MNSYLIDTHCHINLVDDIDTIVMDAKRNGVDKMIISGCDKKSIRDGLEIIYRYDSIYMTIGFHPDEVDSICEQDIKDLEKILLANRRVVGIGEIGLDYYHNDMNIDIQKKYFRLQLDLAQKYNLPVVIHSRESIQDTYDIIKEYQVRGVLHCYSGSLEMANLFIEKGFYLGIGGVLTFKNSHLGEVVDKIPLESLVLETDSPYLSPEPYRGRVNIPANVKVIATALGKIKGIPFDNVVETTMRNTLQIFDLNK